MSLKQTEFGFAWGSLEVTRMASDTWGFIIEVSTPKERVEIRATRGGLLRLGPIISGDSHLPPPDQKPSGQAG